MFTGEEGYPNYKIHTLGTDQLVISLNTEFSINALAMVDPQKRTRNTGIIGSTNLQGLTHKTISLQTFKKRMRYTS